LYDITFDRALAKDQWSTLFRGHGAMLPFEPTPSGPRMPLGGMGSWEPEAKAYLLMNA